MLAFTKGLSVKLQGRYVDVAYAYRHVEDVKDILKQTRSMVDSFHNLVYKEALKLASSVGVKEKVPRFASIQDHRQNIPSDSAQEYYKTLVYIDYLDA